MIDLYVYILHNKTKLKLVIISYKNYFRRDLANFKQTSFRGINFKSKNNSYVITCYYFILYL